MKKNKISKVVQLRLWEPEDVKDAQEFILYLVSAD